MANAGAGEWGSGLQFEGTVPRLAMNLRMRPQVFVGFLYCRKCIKDLRERRWRFLGPIFERCTGLVAGNAIYEQIPVVKTRN